MIRSFRSKPLARFWLKNDVRGIRPDWLKRVTIVLSRLDTVTAPEQMDLPGLGFHALTGSMAGRYAVRVSRNWRITFGWEDEDAIDVDLEDYHGA